MTEKNTRRFLARAAVAGFAALTPALASAAGFQLTEQSVTGLGRAFAGGAAVAEDASSIFYNAAGISQLDKSELLMGGSIISLGADFDRQIAVDAIGQPLSGGEGGDVGKLGGVPVLYYVSPIDEQWTWGIGFNAPFGLATDYEPDSIFRYQAIYSYVSVVNINPTVAYDFGNGFSLGFGLDMQHMRVKLSNMVDYGAVCYGQVDPLTCNALGLRPQSHDGYAEVEGDSIGWGWNLGLLWDLGDTNIGFAYRSQVDHDLEGDSRFENVPAIFQAQGVFLDTPIRADFTTPEMISLALAHRINDAWLLTADITRVGWSTFEELRVRFDNPNQPDTVQPENWEDVYRYSVGLDWRYNSEWTFRAGLALDETPVPDEFRTARLPDEDRTWLSFGATWRMSEDSELTAGYAHLFLDDEIPFSETGSMGDTITGTYEAEADIVGVQYRYTF